MRPATTTSWVPRAARTWKSATKTVLTTSSTEITTSGASVRVTIQSGTPTLVRPNCIAITEVSATDVT